MEEDAQLRSHVLKSMVQDSTEIWGLLDTQTSLCVVCLDNISEHARTKPCAHDFDFVCIINWLERNTSCPLCKTRVLTVEYDRKSWQDVKVYNVQQPSPISADNTGRSPTSNDDRLDELHAVQQAQSQQVPGRHLSRSNTAIEDPHAYRKHIYRHQLYSLHIGSNRLSRFQELTPKCFVHSAELVSRARKWIRRELRVFDFLSFPDQADPLRGPSTRHVNSEYLLEWIIALLKSVDIKGSNGQAENMLQEFLGRDNARLFLHELRAWLRSPYSELQQWDRTVQYDETVSLLPCNQSSVHRHGTKRKRDGDVDHHAPYPDPRLLRLRT